MDEAYELKEEARMRMHEAIADYVKAAQLYGSDHVDIANEVTDVFVNIGETGFKVTVAD